LVLLYFFYEGDVEYSEEDEGRRRKGKTLDGDGALLFTIDLRDSMIYFLTNRSNS